MKPETDLLHKPLTLPTHLFIITAVVVALLLTIIGLLLYQNSLLKQQVQTTIPSPTSSAITQESPTLFAPSDPTANWKTYQSKTYSFEVKYPETVSLYEAKDKDKMAILTYIPVCDPDKTIACFHFPNSKYSATNFRGAGLSIKILEKIVTEQTCSIIETPNNQKIASRQINGITFYMGNQGGAAAGNQNFDTVFRTFYKGKCFEIVERFVTDSSDVNTPPGMVKSITKAEQSSVLMELDQILSTFRFI